MDTLPQKSCWMVCSSDQCMLLPLPKWVTSTDRQTHITWHLGLKPLLGLCSPVCHKQSHPGSQFLLELQSRFGSTHTELDKGNVTGQNTITLGSQKWGEVDTVSKTWTPFHDGSCSQHQRYLCLLTLIKQTNGVGCDNTSKNLEHMCSLVWWFLDTSTGQKIIGSINIANV
jgi:hypothetical protein